MTLLSPQTLLGPNLLFGYGGTAGAFNWAPTLSQVAAILRARTRGPASRDSAVAGEQGEFTTTTRPTAAQVSELIAMACGEMSALMGGREPCTLRLRQSAQTAAIYRAAQLVETSYYPEQTGTDDTAFGALQKMWESTSKAVAVAVADQCPLTAGGSDLDGLPIGRVPCGPIIGRRTAW